MDQRGYQDAAAVLPLRLRREAMTLPEERQALAEELRLRVGRAMTVLLPGGPMEVPVRTCLPVAETVIVGRVPDTYLQLEGLPASG